MATGKKSMDIQTDDLRFEDIKSWIESDLNIQNYQLEPASEDASFRRYFRLSSENKSWIIMDAPPEKEDCQPFVKVATLIEAAGVHAPHIYNFNQLQGFMQLSDLGCTAYLSELNDQTVDVLYADAIQAIVKMQGISADLPEYNSELMAFEMSLFKDWYLEKHLGFQLTDAQNITLENTFNLLSDSALQQKVVFVHRDYHSRNLMIEDTGNSGLINPALSNIALSNPGVIDFQDAVNGPASYDLVSLIKDCYIAWPRAKQLEWIDQYLQLSNIETDRQLFIKQLDFMGMQRHLKATGIFARLNHRDGKPGYLNDIPRTLAYIFDVCERYEELSVFLKLLHSLNVVADKETLDKIK